MAVEVILPRVDMDMTTGRISRWYVGEGETVEKGQPLFEIETDKAAMEIEAPGSGILQDVVAAAEAAIPVGSVVAWIRSPGEIRAVPAPAVDAAPDVASPGETAARVDPPAAVTHEPETAPTTPAILATPLARRLARQNATPLAAIVGSGPRGRIQARDVPNAPRPAVPEVVPQEARAAPAPEDKRAVPAPGVEPQRSEPPDRPHALHRAWLREGSGRPLVLVHGFAAELNGWRPLVSALSPGRPVLAVDLPGHGQSPALPSRPTLESLAEAVAQALADEGVTAADLVGHSLGAAVAAMVVETATFSVASLLLIAPAGLGPDIDGAFVGGLLRARSAESLAPWLRHLVADPAALGPGFVQATLRARSETGLAAQAVVAACLFPDGTQAFSIRDILDRLAVPVRVVVGLADRIIPAHHARDLPGHVALHRLRDVGHMPHLEARPLLARIVDQMAPNLASR